MPGRHSTESGISAYLFLAQLDTLEGLEVIEDTRRECHPTCFP